MANRPTSGIGGKAVRDHRVPCPAVPGPKDRSHRDHAFAAGGRSGRAGWAAALGLRTGVFGLQGDDAGGRTLRAAMDELGIEHQIVIVDAATSLAEIFVDTTGERVIYVAPGATTTTTAEHVREQRAFLEGARVVSTEVSQVPYTPQLSP